MSGWVDVWRRALGWLSGEAEVDGSVVELSDQALYTVAVADTAVYGVVASDSGLYAVGLADDER